MRLLLVLGSVLAAELLLAGAGYAPALAGETHATQKTPAHVVKVSGLGFQPPTLTVHVGDRITWSNDDLIVHTVTAGDHSFDSGDVPGGGSWSWVAHHKGVIHYSCRYHPNMVGTLTVN